MKSTLPFLLLAALTVGDAGAQVPIRDFARDAEWADVKLSPGGDYVATIKQVGNHWAMGFFRLSDMAMTGGLNFGTFDHIVDFWWVSPVRVVVAMGHSYGYFDPPFSTGEFYGIDFDGSNKEYLIGSRGNAQSNLDAYAEMVDPMPQDPDWALIMTSPWGRNTTTHRLYRMNVYTGIIKEENSARFDHVSGYLTDRQGRPRYAIGTDDKFWTRSYVRNLQDNTWSEMTQGSLEKATIVPLAFSEQENAAYFDSDEANLDLDCLVRQDLATGKRSAVMCDPEQTLADVVYSADQSRPIAALFNAGRPELRVLAPDSADGKLLTTLISTFPDKALGAFSWSLDGSKLVFLAYSDNDPGTYYLLDVTKGKIKRLFATRPWIKPAQMAERRPVTFKARDGRTMHGYLTLPPGREAKNLPLVVNPHGGPFGVRDHWGWTPEPQLLASRGYAVLQVNFRGSAGYGNHHADAGKKNWGVDMINDLTDGLRYVVKAGYADPNRACIYGASFGGYASMMSVLREPDVYQCAIPFAGVYDIASFKRFSDIRKSKQGEYYLGEFVANTPETEREQSPVTHVARLKAAVFIAHGIDDKRAPYQQAKLMRDALGHAGRPFEWMAVRDEGHGFSKVDNRVEFYEKMLAFLEKHIGPGAPIAQDKPKK